MTIPTLDDGSPDWFAFYHKMKAAMNEPKGIEYLKAFYDHAKAKGRSEMKEEAAKVAEKEASLLENLAYKDGNQTNGVFLSKAVAVHEIAQAIRELKP